MDVIFRKATLNDAYGIEYVGAHSWNETYSDFMPKEYLENRIKTIDSKIDRAKDLLSKTDTYYVAEVDGKVVGILHYKNSNNDKFKNYGYLESIYVLKKYQGIGIGKELFKIAIQGIIELGYNDMYLECISESPTMGFYKKYNGMTVDTIDYPIRDFSVKANVIVFNDLQNIYKDMVKENK